jgi:hypothetical protein
MTYPVNSDRVLKAHIIWPSYAVCRYITEPRSVEENQILMTNAAASRTGVDHF